MSIHTGVYLNWNRNTAIVVRVKSHLVTYLTMRSGAIELLETSESKFMRDWPTRMPSYPVVRALRTYAKCELTRTDEADKVMRLVLANAKAQR